MIFLNYSMLMTVSPTKCSVSKVFLFCSHIFTPLFAGAMENRHFTRYHKILIKSVYKASQALYTRNKSTVLFCTGSPQVFNLLGQIHYFVPKILPIAFWLPITQENWHELTRLKMVNILPYASKGLVQLKKSSVNI